MLAISLRIAIALSGLLCAMADGSDVENVLKGRLTSPVDQHPCVRLLKAGGDIGCSSGFNS
jgi:hypothetical protein